MNNAIIADKNHFDVMILTEPEAGRLKLLESATGMNRCAKGGES